MPKHGIEIWHQLANEMIGNDVYEEALYYFDRILEVDPLSHEAVNGKAYMLDILGKVEEALEYINNYLERNSLDTYIWILKGDLLHIHHNDYEGALECFNQAITIDPKNEEAWIKKAYALKEIGKYTEAAECFKTAMQLFNETSILEYPVEYWECFLEYYRELSEEYNNCFKIRGS